MKIMENKSSIFQKDEITKRNFYLQLFRTYCELPFKDTMQSFVKVFNDVFVKEKPQICQKYYLTEVDIIELDTRDKNCHEMSVGYRWNFASGTSKELNYFNSPFIHTFVMSCLKSIKKSDGVKIADFSPRKRDEGSKYHSIMLKQARNAKFELPNNGREFFFSNVLVKIYQVPTLFMQNSEAEINNDESTYIILFYEKSMRKRTFAKS